MKKHITEIMAEDMTTFLKPLNMPMDERVGNIMRLDISMVPIIRIPTTIVRAVRTAMRVLYMSALIPVALAKSVSKVIANILW